MVKLVYYNRINNKVFFAIEFMSIGRILDENLASTNNLVLRDQGAMDAIFGIHNLIISERVIASFIPTVGIDFNPTDAKRKEVLKYRQAWTSQYDKKKYSYLKSCSKV